MQNNPINTIDELKLIKEWVLDMIEVSDIDSEMTPYAPIVYVKIPVDLSDSTVPKEIFEAVKTKYYTKDE